MIQNSKPKSSNSEIMKETDLYKVQELCVRLFAQTLSQQAVYESMLRNPLPKMP